MGRLDPTTNTFSAAGVGFFTSVIVVWAINEFLPMVEIPDPVAQAIAGIFTVIAGLILPAETARQRRRREIEEIR